MVAFPGPFFFLGACHIWVVWAFYSDMNVNTGMKLGFWLIFKGPHLWSSGFANNKGAYLPAHPCSLISAFVLRLLKSIISRLTTSELSIF